MRKERILLLMVVLGVSLVAACAMAPKSVSSPPYTAVLWPSSQIQWVSSPSPEGAKVAVLTGNPDTGPFRALERWPAGTYVGLHHHSNEARGLVHSGRMLLKMEGQQAVELGPGSWVIVPARARHETTCLRGEDCVFYIEMPGRGDTVMAQ